MNKGALFCVLIILLGTFLTTSLSAKTTPFSVDTVLVSESSAEVSKTTVDAETVELIEEQIEEEKIKKDGYPVSGTIVGCSSLRLRSWPWGMVGGSYPSGTKVTVTGESGEFYTVIVNGVKGYMHRNYINTPKSPATGVAPYYPGNTASGGYLPQKEGIAYSDFAAGETSVVPSSDSSSPSSSSQSSYADAGTSGSSVSNSGVSNFVGNAPAPKPQLSYGGASVTTNSPAFESWVSDALNQYSSDWGFPQNLTNKYGERVTPRDYVMAIIFIESSGIHQNSGGKITTSSCGALGFMQLMPKTASGLGVDPKNPQQNVLGGVKFFKEIFNSKNFKNKTGIDKIVMGACAYNMGPYSSKLAGSWGQFKASGSSVQGYGIKLKMCLGLELSSDERMYVANRMGHRDVDAYAKSCYANRKGLGR
ncbi:MAG: lytic transglycosylase domain-containing protein [Candidatus Riflebacteria bacterium]|nr:lytic transglycosylase domain-containing protein [Candidatus Riflebacteria bacterium]